MKSYKLWIAAVLLLGSSSCNKWFDVTPSTEMKADVLFSDEAGFRDALTGIYVLMSQKDAYGSELSMAYIDVLAQTYDNVRSNAGHSYRDAANYAYNETTEEARLLRIWKQQYKAIANLNILLDKADENRNVFTGNNYNVIKGEAYALRAFLHFDLLRLFGHSPQRGLERPAIPYVDAHTNVPFVQGTAGEVIAAILADLEEARALLKAVDPMGPALADDQNGSLATGNRQIRMNYYAATALMARVHLYQGNKTSALEKAVEVIDSKLFPAFDAASVTGSGDYIFTSEHVFALQISDLKTRYSDLFFPTIDHATNPVALVLNNSQLNNIFPAGLNTDYRNNWFEAASGTTKRIAKYAYNVFIPLIKISEMYLIAAESEPDKDIAVTEYLNELKIHRGLAPLDAPSTTTEMLGQEIAAEYRREFIGEGQLFYYYKRLDVQKLPTIAQFTDSDAVYSLPIPVSESEFGIMR
jgi:hypothetical protein